MEKLDSHFKGRYNDDLKHGRYWRSWNTLKPIRFNKKHDLESPLDNAGLLSFMTFQWLTKLIYSAKKAPLRLDQIPTLSRYEKAEFCAERLERLYEEEVKSKGQRGAIKRSFIRFIRTRMLVSGVVITICVVFAMIGPAVIVDRLITYLVDEDIPLGYGIGLAFALVVTEMGRCFLFCLFWAINYRTCVRAKSAVLTLVFQKVARLRTLKDKSVGELVNLISGDGQRISEMVMFGGITLGSPLSVLFAAIYSYYLIGPTALVGIAIFVLFVPLQLYLSGVNTELRKKCVVITDKRVRMMNEVLTCVKLIKMYAWELSFAKTIAAIRSNERSILQRQAIITSFQISFIPFVPILATVLTFLVHTLIGEYLDAPKAFSIIAIFNAMRFILAVLPITVKSISEVFVSLDRMGDILAMEVMSDYITKPRLKENAIELKDITAAWEIIDTTKKDKKAKANQKIKPDGELEYQIVFNKLHLEVRKFSLVGVCGPIGSGKTSLVNTILGRTKILDGTIAIQGDLAYVPQQAWIFHASVRENILFGKKFNQEKYDQVVEACSLKMDFEILTDGDMTEVGERGINLSGGQKQRISLARAVYSDNEVVILDDPLSAVDAHVGKHIFFECIKKHLTNRTVLFVTHQLQYLKDCDTVIYLKDGSVKEIGCHETLMQNKQEYFELIKNFYLEQENNENKDKTEVPTNLARAMARQRTLSGASTTDGDQTSARRASINTSSKWKRAERIGSIKSYVDSLQPEGGTMVTDVDIPEFNEEDTNTHQNDDKKTQTVLIKAETSKIGSVSLQTYKSYIEAGGGYVICLICFVLFVLLIFGTTASNWWLSYWLNQGGAKTQVCGNDFTATGPSRVDNVTVNSAEATASDGMTLEGPNCTEITDPNISSGADLLYYQLIYVGILVGTLLLVFIKAWMFAKVTLGASSKLHDVVFKKVFGSPMSFFDTTPTGRILNRFSKDMDDQDVRLPQMMETFLMQAWMVIFSIVILVMVFPAFIIIVVIVAIVFSYFYRLFKVAVRDLKRVDNITRSPIISHVSSTVQGLSTIHAYKKTDDFIDKFNHVQDVNSSPYICYYASMRWLAIRLDMMTITITLIITIILVLTKYYPEIDFTGTITPSNAGLALSYSIQMTGLFQVCVRFSVETEAFFTAVERVVEYIFGCPSEAASEINEINLPSSWPDKGEIRFNKAAMRYRPGLPLVLRGIRFTIKPREKIGIVGRTGSGKSSLGVVLFRLVELDRGSIIIDKVDIAKIGLKQLRRNISIIPQDPVLFVGTIRYNLDPFEEHSDSVIWGALEKTHVKQLISSLPDKLMTEVVENGENFSVGERQLLCMARALLRHSRIIMLDEATAAIDSETDALVQETIRDAFSDCTMLTIAHRLNTVLTCDRILVMDNGYVAEFDSPSNLLANAESQFSQMVLAAASHKGGQSSFEKISEEYTPTFEDAYTYNIGSLDSEAMQNEIRENARNVAISSKPGQDNQSFVSDGDSEAKI